MSSNFNCQNLDRLFPQYIFNLALKFVSFVLLSSLVAPTYLDYFKMSLFWTTLQQKNLSSNYLKQQQEFILMPAAKYVWPPPVPDQHSLRSLGANKDGKIGGKLSVTI